MDIVALEPAHTDDFLRLEAFASAPYSEFVYADMEQARSISRALFEQGACEFSARHGCVLLDDARVVGMMACLSGAELREQRLQAALSSHRMGLFDDDPAMRARIRRAAGTLAEVEPGDFYLSRIAVEPAARGRGCGRFMLRWLEAEGRRRGFWRVVLEVSPASQGAEAFYKRNGFVEFARKDAEDRESGRRLEYIHLEKSLRDG